MLHLWLLVLMIMSGCGATKKPASTLSVVVDESPQPASRVWHLRAVTAESRGDLEEADRSMEWAVRMNRSNPWVHLAQGRYLERQGRAAEALKAYENARTLGGSAAVYEALGGAFFRLERDVEAISALEVADSQQAYAGLAAHFIEAEDRERGGLILERWSVFAPEKRWVLPRTTLATWLGVQPLVWADYVALLDETRSLSKTTEALDAALGSCAQGAVWEWAREHQVSYWGPGWRDWALQVALVAEDATWYEQLLREKVTSDGAVAPLLVYLLAERRFEPLRERAQALLEEEPDSLDGHRFLGAAYRGIYRFDDAIVEWRWVLERAPTDEEAVRMLIGLRIDQGLLAEALSVAESFLEATGESESGRILYATVLAETGDQKGALEVAEDLSKASRESLLVELLLESAELEKAWSISEDSEEVALMARVARHASQTESTERAVDYWSELQRLGHGSQASRPLYDLQAITLEKALAEAPCEPALLATAWEESRSCADLDVLRRAYRAFPTRFVDQFSQGAARCDRWPEALSAAEWAIRIEDSEARRRHLDYVQRAAAKFERARRKP